MKRRSVASTQELNSRSSFPFTHLDRRGRARMVDVGDKPVTLREAVARAEVRMRPSTLTLPRGRKLPKGDVLAAGLDPVKINVVVLRGMNDDEIPDFVRLSREEPVHVRFIELMPLGSARRLGQERRVSLEEMRRRCGPLLPVTGSDKPAGSGPAVYSRSPGGRGTVGG